MKILQNIALWNKNIVLKWNNGFVSFIKYYYKYYLKVDSKNIYHR